MRSRRPDTLAIAHKTARPDQRVVVDAVREVRPPFSPLAVVDDFSTLLKNYRVSKVVGDHYGGEFVKEPFRRLGISYEVCKQPNSDLFRDMLPLLNAGHITLPRHDQLIARPGPCCRGWRAASSPICFVLTRPTTIRLGRTCR